MSGLLAAVDAPLIVLVDAASDVERRLVREALTGDGEHPSTIRSLRDPALSDTLEDAGPDAVVTAVRVIWTPPQTTARATAQPGAQPATDPADGPAGGRTEGAAERSAEGSAEAAAARPAPRTGRRRRPRLSAVPLLPRRPPAPLQPVTLRFDPSRARVVVAEPASVAELSARWAGRGSLAEFVAGQAALALDRAERAVVGHRAKFPRRVPESIESAPEFRREVAALAERLELPEPEVRARASQDLRGLVASMDRVATEVFTEALRPLHARAWDVRADAAGLERLRELNRRHPLVFLPSHRSYVDPLVLADVLDAHDFPRNHVLGGDNLRIWPIAPLAKRAGMIFIRRRFNDDEVYKLAVREYFAFLLAKRFNLEWYMEGGRTRTGKLRPPRYGLLSFVADAVERRRVDDVLLVPVSITYDQLHEVTNMAAEQGGAAKRSEGLSWLASYARAQRTRLGTVQVSFGEPLSLASALRVDKAGAVDRDAGDDGGTRDDRRLGLQKAAFEVAVRINKVTPATAPALVTLALLGVRDRALTLAQVQRVVEPVLDYLDERGLPHSGATLRSPRGVRRVLAALTDQSVVTTYDGGEEPVYAIEPGQHLVAAFYRNSAIHHFVDRAIAELVLLHDPADRWDEAMRLRDQLKFEFFFPEREAYREQLSAELERLDPGWETGDGRDVLCRAPLLVAHRVLRSFVDAQLVVAERLAARDPRKPVAEAEFLAECGGVGRQMLLQGRLHGPESLSRELFATALKLAGNLDLVDPGREEVARRRQEWAAQVGGVVERVAVIDELDAAARRQAVGVQP
jgi:glycerol-3-phosphate O-acyltransferase